MFDDYIVSEIIKYMDPSSLYLFGRGCPGHTNVIKQLLNERKQILFVNMSRAVFLDRSVMIIKCVEMIEAYILDPITKKISYIGFDGIPDNDHENYMFTVVETDDWDHIMINSNNVAKIENGTLFEFGRPYRTGYKVSIIHNFAEFEELVIRLSKLPVEDYIVDFDDENSDDDPHDFRGEGPYEVVEEDREEDETKDHAEYVICSLFDHRNMIANIQVKKNEDVIEDIYVPHCMLVDADKFVNTIVRFDGKTKNIFNETVKKVVLNTRKIYNFRMSFITLNGWMDITGKLSVNFVSLETGTMWIYYDNDDDDNIVREYVNEFKVIYKPDY